MNIPDDMTLRDLARQSPEAREEIRHLLAQFTDVCGVMLFQNGTPIGSCTEPVVIVKLEEGLPIGLCATHTSQAR